ncbi:MAG: hypothetical protein HRT35_14870 [Algicola sp.]|nr:hypothetical protein [Algicola sp.]
MDIQPTNEKELTAAHLLDKQRRYNKLITKFERLRINSLVILISPMLLSLIPLILTGFGVGVSDDFMLFGFMGLITMLFIWLNDRMEILYKLLILKTENDTK